MNEYFQSQHQQLVFPPAYFLYETYQLDYGLYYSDGLATAGEIVDSIKKHLQPGTGIAILDWGCGPGRITRHLPGLLPPGSQVFGTDYNKKYIQWCTHNIPGISWTVNDINPPLPFGAESFDAVIGLSIFTHLAESNHPAWVKELHRITKPGGIIYLTTQGNAFRTKLTSEEIQLFDAGKLVMRKTRREGHRLYSTFHPVAYMQNLFSPFFEICELVEGSNLQPDEPAQDTWILAKK
jgi:SAM-dependent methyltransferase